MPDEVLNRVREEHKTVAKHRESWLDILTRWGQFLFQPGYALVYVAVALLVVAGIYFLNPTDDVRTVAEATAILDEVPDEVLQAYISDNIDEFDEMLLTEQLASNTDETLPTIESEQSEEILDELLDDLEVEELEELL